MYINKTTTTTTAATTTTTTTTTTQQLYKLKQTKQLNYSNTLTVNTKDMGGACGSSQRVCPEYLSYEEFARLAETRLAQNTFKYISITYVTVT